MMTVDQFNEKFRDITGFKFDDLEQELVSGLYTIFREYIDVNEYIYDALHRVGQFSNGYGTIEYTGADNTVECYYKRIHGVIHCVPPRKYKAILNNMIIKYVALVKYCTGNLQNFDVQRFIDDLTTLEVNTLLCTAIVARNENICKQLISKCNPYMLDFQMITTPAIKLMDGRNYEMFQAFADVHVKDAFDLVRLFNHCKDHDYQTGCMMELYNKFIQRSDEYPDMYIHITNRAMSQYDLSFLTKWLKRNKPTKGMIFTVDYAPDYIMLQEIAKYTDITKIVMKETSYSLLHHELIQTKLDYNSIRLLLYHHGNLNKVKIGDEPLAIFVAKLNNPLIRLMVQEYAINWNVKCNKGFSSLHYACQADNKEMAYFLIDQGVRMDASTAKLNHSITDYYNRRMTEIGTIQEHQNESSNFALLSSLMSSSKSMM